MSTAGEYASLRGEALVLRRESKDLRQKGASENGHMEALCHRGAPEGAPGPNDRRVKVPATSDQPAHAGSTALTQPAGSLLWLPLLCLISDHLGSTLGTEAMCFIHPSMSWQPQQVSVPPHALGFGIVPLNRLLQKLQGHLK